MKTKDLHPPKLAEIILKLFSRTDEHTYRLGDMAEVFEFMLKSDGYAKASRWYWAQTFKSIPNLIFNSIYCGGTMFKSYLKMGLRDIKKNKIYSLINIVGLSIGLACCILIMLWLRDELNFDKIHTKADTIYRVIQTVDNGGQLTDLARTPVPLAPALKEGFTEIEKSTHLASTNLSFKFNNETITQKGAFVDPDFLEMFSFDLSSGTKPAALADPLSIVITKEMATTFFGDENPIGKSIEMSPEIVFNVTGVIEKPPVNSHIDFNYLVPFELLKKFGLPFDNWLNSNNTIYTYIELKDNADISNLTAKSENIIKENDERVKSKIFFQPFNEIHLYSSFSGDVAGHGNINYIYISLIIGIFVLFIACFNFMNLSTAKAGSRACEIGIRKVTGATKKELMFQFLTESIFITFIAMLLAFIFVSIILPTFNEISGKSLELNFFSDQQFLIASILITIVTGIFAGIYPAFILSNFEPASVLKGSYQSNKKGAKFRRALVVLQFALSTALMIGSFIIYSQLEYIQNKDLGFNKEYLVYHHMSDEARENYQAIKIELLKNSSIKNVSVCSHLLTDVTHVMGNVTWEGKDPDVNANFNCLLADEDFLKTFGMQLIEGRDFIKKNPDDTKRTVIINEKASSLMNLKDPIGKIIKYGDREASIVGVVNNFHFKPMQNEIEPMILFNSGTEKYYLYVKINSNDIQNTLSYIGNVWNTFVTKETYDPKFFDEAVSEMYENENNVESIFQFFTFLAIFISCLGLVGLISYITEQRKKEVGIRKVCGASVTTIALLIVKDFIWWILAANVIAWPIAYFAMNKWLENFAYRIDIALWSFLFSGGLVLLIAIGIISFQSVKAAQANPVDSLKDE